MVKKLKLDSFFRPKSASTVSQPISPDSPPLAPSPSTAPPLTPSKYQLISRSHQQCFRGLSWLLCLRVIPTLYLHCTVMAEKYQYYYLFIINFNLILQILFFYFTIYLLHFPYVFPHMLMLRYVCGSSCGTFMVNIVVTYQSFTSWNIQPPCYRTISFNGHPLSPISSVMREFSVYCLWQTMSPETKHASSMLHVYTHIYIYMFVYIYLNVFICFRLCIVGSS